MALRLWLGVLPLLTACSAAAPGPHDVFGVSDAGEAVTVPPFDPKDGLILHYTFNETAGEVVHDFAGVAGLNDGIIVGAPSGHQQWEAAGRFLGALRLAGNEVPDGGVGHHVELPQGVLHGLSECSIAVWVNRAGGQMWQRVFDFGSGLPVWLYFTPFGVGNLPAVAGVTPAGVFVDFKPIPEELAAEPPAGRGVLRIDRPILVSTWVHFVLTWQADRMAVYLDGQLVAEAATVGRVIPHDLGWTGQNYLGRSQYNDPYFAGMLDEFRVYDRALTASEVLKLSALE